jgi:hypothetical protein
MLELDTLIVLREILYSHTLNIGSPDFQETTTRILAAYADLNAAIVVATTEPWPGNNPFDECPQIEKVGVENG